MDLEEDLINLMELKLKIDISIKIKVQEEILEEKMIRVII